LPAACKATGVPAAQKGHRLMAWREWSRRQ